MDGSAALRPALDGTDPSLTERLFVDRVVVCHVALTGVEGSVSALPVIIGVSGHVHVDRLQRRYLETVKAFAPVRRLRLSSSSPFTGGQHLHVAPE